MNAKADAMLAASPPAETGEGEAFTANDIAAILEQNADADAEGLHNASQLAQKIYLLARAQPVSPSEGEAESPWMEFMGCCNQHPEDGHSPDCRTRGPDFAPQPLPQDRRLPLQPDGGKLMGRSLGCRTKRFGIMNHVGSIWTIESFDREEEAQGYLDTCRAEWKRKGWGDLSKHSVVPVEVTVTPASRQKDQSHD